MGYTTDDSIVRVDVFKPNGKWYETIAIKWLSLNGNKLIHEAFYEALDNDKHAHDYLHSTDTKWVFVCLEPYHEHSHPIILGLGYH